MARLGDEEVNAFLTHLAVDEHVSASVQTQALWVLLTLYCHALGREAVTRSRRPCHCAPATRCVPARAEA